MRAVLLTVALLGALCVAQDKPWRSVVYNDQTAKYNLVDRKAPNAVAYGYFLDEVEQTGWGKLFITTNEDFDDSMQMHAAGYLEGALMQLGIWYVWLDGLSVNQTDLPANVLQYISDNLEYTQQMVAEYQDTEPFWLQTGLVVEQLLGMYEAYSLYAPQDQALTLVQLTSISAMGDISEIETFINNNASSRSFKSKPAESHCSVLVKIKDDYSDVFFGHTTWSSFNSMLRTYKFYNFPLSSNVSAVRVSFSSYPGCLSSTDDFFLTSSGLAVTETTNMCNNASQYASLTPQTGVLSWIRAMVANRMATSARDWTTWFAMANSGTYNNQWIIMDYNLFTPGQPLPDNSLWIIEQMPTQCLSEDVTPYLRLGYWPSYNVPYFEENFAMCDFESQVKRFGPYLSSYDMCARAEIFRREHGKVEDMESFQRVMRFNEWQTDPFSVGNAGLSVAARFDLVNKPYPENPTLQQALFGGIDSKVTSYHLATKMVAWAESGPTHQNQPPFSWAQWLDQPHFGLPMVFNFTFERMDFNADLHA